MRGFHNINRVEWAEVNVGRLSSFKANAEVTPETLMQAGLVREADRPIVLLGQGHVSVPLRVRLHRVTKGARAKIEAAGGSVEVIEG